jgi:hypothetical protein
MRALLAASLRVRSHASGLSAQLNSTKHFSPPSNSTVLREMTAREVPLDFFAIASNYSCSNPRSLTH